MHRENRCMYMAHVCFMSVVVTVCDWVCGYVSKDASLDVFADCGKTLHDVKHLFNCPAHPTTMTPSDLWDRPVDAIRELIYLDAEVLD